MPRHPRTEVLSRTEKFTPCLDVRMLAPPVADAL